MAKGSNIITDGLSGPLGKLRFVRSKKYGQHVRSPRGTFKPAVLNDTMAVSSEQLASAVAPAKAIFNAVRGEHKDGDLWNKLLVIFRRQLKAGRGFNTHDLKDLECNAQFTLEKLMLCTEYKIQLVEKEHALCIGLFLKKHPQWLHLHWKHTFQYRLSMIVVYPDFSGGSFIKEVSNGPITEFTAPVEPLSFEVAIPDGADRYLVFMLAEVWEHGKAVTMTHTKGMRVVGMGQVSNTPEAEE